MRTVSEPGWDGPANLMAAVRTAVHPDARGRGVLIVVGEEVHARGRGHQVARAEPGRVPQPARPARRPWSATAWRSSGRRSARARPCRRGGSWRRSTCTRWRAGVDDALLRASLARGARGLVLEATGCGNVPPAALPGLRAALAARVPVVVVSRCPEGGVVPAYGYEGGGRMLRDLGVILGGELPGPKARIQLMVALGVTSDIGQLRALVNG